jgi:hypothetical protein
MTPEQYKAIRRKFFPDDPTAFLMEMGYGGDFSLNAVRNLRTKALRFENGRLPIPRHIARFAWLLDQWRLQGAQLGEHLDDLPEWPDEDK